MKNARPNEPPMPDALAYYLTWGTYGTWLPGDERGWNLNGFCWQPPDPIRKVEAEARMTEDACRLDPEQREGVERQVAETCAFRGWTLHAVSCRTNHVHVVVTANGDPKIVRNQLKAWCTRRLRELENRRRQANREAEPSSVREEWWAERGSQRFLNDEESLNAASVYVRDGQDRPRER
jgi:REP element-mobilizing transposase RayT